MHDPKRTLFYVFKLSFEKIFCFLLSLCFCSNKKVTSKNNLILLTFSLYFFLSLFSFFVSSLFVYSPCRYSSCSLFFCSMLPLLLFALFMFIYSLLCFFCLCLFPFFDFFCISIIYFSFLLKNHSFLNWSSLFVKLFWFYRFFLFRPFSGCFFW